MIQIFYTESSFISKIKEGIPPFGKMPYKYATTHSFLLLLKIREIHFVLRIISGFDFCRKTCLALLPFGSFDYTLE